jgi:hypothetical protein
MIIIKIYITALIISVALGVFSLNKMDDADDVSDEIWWGKISKICFYFFYGLLIIGAITLIWML